MANELIQLTIVDGTGRHEESCSAVIGIEIKEGKALLYIFENGDLSEEFWRKLPDAMKATIEQGIESRREANDGNKSR
jgi:hypothetical protein